MFRGAVILNGSSSAGKTSIIRALQLILEEAWMLFGIDDFLRTLPINPDDPLLRIESGGAIVLGDDFRRLERAWMLGVAATARAGANVLIDDVFLSGRASQMRWIDALGDVPRRFVAVRCDPAVAIAREKARGDRDIGLAVTQAGIVHEGVEYDFEVDTTHAGIDACARLIAQYLTREG